MITARRLREALSYSRGTGEFRWRIRPSNRVSVGDPAGSASRGYLLIRVDGVLYQAGRLAVLYVTGKLPTNVVDHRNGNGLDNRWRNLRPCSQPKNLLNRKCSSNNLLGLRGVSTRRGKFFARIGKDGVTYYLGTFDTKKEAAAARRKAERELFGEFACNR